MFFLFSLLLLSTAAGQSFLDSLLAVSNNIEDECTERFKGLLEDPQTSALFVDALGKPTSGFLVGNLQWLGDYDLCLQLGQAGLSPCYSKAIVPLSTNYSAPLLWTHCLPPECKDVFMDLLIATLDEYVTPIAKYFDPEKKYPIIHDIGQLEVNLTTVCQEEKKYDAGAVIAVLLCTLFLLLTVAGTLRGPLMQYIRWSIGECTSSPDEDGQVITNISCKDVKMLKDVQKDWQARPLDNPSRDIVNGGNEYVDVELREEGVSEAEATNYQELPDLLDGVGDDPEEETETVVNAAQLGANETPVKTTLVVDPVLKCFSLQRNLQILLDTKTKPGQVLCMNGIRSLSIGWVVVSHMYLIPLLTGMGKGFQANEVAKRRSFEIVLNGFPSVDSFFLMSGFLVSFLLLKTLRKGRSFKSLAAGYYIHRYIRLTVPYLMVILLEGFIYHILITGPTTEFVELQHENCKDWWWSNLLYINNFVPWTVPSKCIGQAWYLANDMQFFAIAPIFVLLLHWRPTIGHIAISSLVALSVLLGGIVTWALNLSATPVSGGLTELGSTYFYILYTKPYFRLVPYFIGMQGAWIFLHYERTLEGARKIRPMNKLVLAVPLWVVTIVIEFATVFGLHTGAGLMTVAEPFSKTVTNNSLYKLGWSVALLIQIFLCHFGLGGPINSLLSWKGWLPVARLSYGVYLLHYGLNRAWVAQLRHVYSFLPDFQSVIIFLGFISTVNLLAAILFLTVEQPMANLEKLITARHTKPRG